MTLTAVHQFVSSFVPRDAVSAHTLALRDVLRDLGLDSEIYVKEARGEVQKEAHYYRDYEAGGPVESTRLLYQAATGSAVAEFLLDRPERKLVNYHNITPPEFFERWEPHMTLELEVGLRQMRELAPVTDLAICDSAFNARELAPLGYDDVEVLPVLFDAGGDRDGVDAATATRLERLKRDGGADLLFVGRLVPSKAQHRLVEALAVYRRLYDPGARLHLIGTPSATTYAATVERYATELGLDDAVFVEGSVPPGVLNAHYQGCDVFVCLSEHEGFCIPVVEAMARGMPVVGHDAGAVPETVGEAGIVVDGHDLTLVAAAIHRAMADEAVRRYLVDAGHRRVRCFDAESTRERFRDLFAGLAGRLG